MANEVYQLKVNGDDIKLGKGPNPEDEFVSFKETFRKAFSGFAYLDVTLTDSGETLQIIFPVTAAFSETNGKDIIHTITKGKMCWPVYNGGSQRLQMPITGLFKDAVQDAQGKRHGFNVKAISFVQIHNYL